MKRPTACAICGVLICAHLVAADVHEASHQHHAERQPAITDRALPPAPDHTHEEHEATARIQDVDVAMTGALTGSTPASPSVRRFPNAWRAGYSLRRPGFVPRPSA